MARVFIKADEYGSYSISGMNAGEHLRLMKSHSFTFYILNDDDYAFDPLKYESVFPKDFC